MNDKTKVFEKDTISGVRKADRNPVYEEVTFKDSNLKCAIIAEGWPSWLSGVLALNITPVAIYSGMEGKASAFYSNALRGLWKHTSKIAVNLLNKLDAVFISGAMQFFLKFSKLNVTTMKICIIEGQQPHRRMLKPFCNFTWERIRHSSCGGVTNVQCWYGWTGERKLIPNETLPKRSIIHNISSSSKIFQVETNSPQDPSCLYNKPVYKSSEVLFSSGLLPITNVGIRVVCPSVFTRTKWCERKLTIKEVAECFDQSHDIIEKCVATKLKVNEAPFIYGMPDKMIHHVLKRLDFVDIKRIQHSDSEVSRPLPVISVPPTIELKHLKAVKADDADVDTYIWDERVLNRFSHVKYDDKIVEKLNILRRFFLRLWVRRVVRSFMRYLQAEYGNNWRMSRSKCDVNSELYKDIERFTDCAYRVRGASWFEWTEGSTLLFWR